MIVNIVTEVLTGIMYIYMFFDKRMTKRLERHMTAASTESPSDAKGSASVIEKAEPESVSD
jgi:hypothetical protein